MESIDFNVWIESSVAEVLESMCFLFPTGEAVPETEGGESDWLLSRLHFSGVPSGSFGLRASVPTARTIAANFLGEEPECVTEAQAEEVIAEMANMVCGSLLGRYEPRRQFSLSTPTCCLGETKTGPKAGLYSKAFALDEGVLEAWLEIGEWA